MTVPPSPERSGVIELPQAGTGAHPLRADALRNRARVLEAARRVIGRVGAADLTMDAVAAEAGVGKGTVFRRFGDRSSLLLALLDAEERSLQDRTLHGPAPLGPHGEATPLERLIAYGEARLAHFERHGAVLAAAGEHVRGHAEFEHPAERSARLHLTHLLQGAGRDRSLASVFASALLGVLNPGRVEHLRTIEGHTPAELLTVWTELARGAVGAGKAEPPVSSLT